MLLKDASRTKYERMSLAITVLEMPTMSIVKSLEPLRAINWNDARPWIVMLGAVILFLGWELRKKRREIQKLDLEIAQLRSQQSLVRLATIHEMNSLIKDVEEISARKLGILGGTSPLEDFGNIGLFWIALGPKSYGKFVSACHPRRKVMSTVEERRVVAIVDDEKPVCRAIGRLVMSAGFKSEIFSSAEEFLCSCRERRPDCLILDLSLPGMSGLELQQQLAADCCRTPIVVVSAHNDPVSRSQALQGGAVAFLGKPFDDEALLEAVHSAMKPENPK